MPRNRRKTNREALKITGSNNEYKVVQGVFKTFNSYGLPLSITIHSLRLSGYLPDWVAFLDDARRAGWPDKTTLARLSEAVIEVFGIKFYTPWRIKMESYVRKAPPASVDKQV